MKQKAIFFLRHYNDIDHIVPIIHKWCSLEKVPIHIIITSSRNLLEDYRLDLLKQFNNINIFFIDDIFTLRDEISIEKTLYSIFQNVDNGLIVFDWIMLTSINDMIISIVKWAQKNQILTVSLPHGDNPQQNQMLFINEFNYDKTDIYWPSCIFDYIVVPNESCAKRYRPNMDSERIKVFGSPRYNDEWLGVLQKIIPVYEKKESEGKLKIGFFVFHRAFSGFWEEVINTIKLVTQFQEIHLIVVGHTRVDQKNHPLYYYGLDECIRKIPNVELVDENIPSSSIMQWADIVMDMGTSIVFEAVKRNKPIISLEYLHATYNKISHYFKDSIMLSRDNLYDIVKCFIDNKGIITYSEEEKERFIDEVIDIDGPEVLERYTRFLHNCIVGNYKLKFEQIQEKNKFINRLLTSDIKVETEGRIPYINKIILDKNMTINNLQNTVNRMQNTISWRITKPLRSKYLHVIKNWIFQRKEKG